MLFLRHLCLVLIGLRLLVPPSVCLCQLTGQAVCLVSGLLRPDLPPPEPEEHDDHADGCPASRMSVGMGVPPVSVPPLVARDTASPAGFEMSLAPVPADHNTPRYFSRAPDTPLCLTLCALLL
jgi:hypothetical protein